MTSDGTTLYYAVDTAIYALSLANNTSMPFALSPSQVADIAVDLSNVYWINGGGDVMMLAKADAGSPATVLATGQLQPNRIAVDGSSVFWTNLGQTAGQGSVGMVSLGGGPARMLALSQAYPWGIAVDVFGVYWTTFGDGSVWMMAR
jgi:hypothetical protein